MGDETRNVNSLEILGEIGLRNVFDTVVRRLEA